MSIKNQIQILIVVSLIVLFPSFIVRGSEIHYLVPSQLLLIIVMGYFLILRFQRIELLNQEIRAQKEHLSSAIIHVEQEKKNSMEFRQTVQQIIHDIRSPMMALDVSLSKMDQDFFATPRGSLVSKGYQRMKEIVDEINDEVKEPSSHSVDECCHAGTLLKEVAQRFSLKADIKNNIDFYYTDNLAQQFTDRIPLSGKVFCRLIENLLVNAYQAHQSNPGAVELYCENNSKNLIITVSDQGCGIADIKKYGKRGWTTKRNGTGLGSFFVCQVMNSIDGSIEIQSKKGHGTQITLEIPLRDSNIVKTSN